MSDLAVDYATAACPVLSLDGQAYTFDPECPAAARLRALAADRPAEFARLLGDPALLGNAVVALVRGPVDPALAGRLASLSEFDAPGLRWALVNLLLAAGPGPEPSPVPEKIAEPPTRPGPFRRLAALATRFRGWGT